MWIAKFVIKHDCILGNRCEKFNVTLQSSGLQLYEERGKIVSSSMHYMSGEEKNLDKFIEDLKKDKKVISIERKNNMFFLLERAEEKAIQFTTPKILFIKPVVMDNKGYETWEVSSWKREEIERFLTKVEKHFDDYKLLKLKETKVDNVFFPRLMPTLTEKQKHAVDLAIQHGYYKNPRQISLRELAKLMNISLATYQQHLRSAEEKLIPNLIYYTF